MTDEHVPMEQAEPAPFVITPELQAAIQAAYGAVQNRTFAGRNPQLGKMINCVVCCSRHRKNEKVCEQVFTYRVDHNNYELLKENEQGELVPDYRTAAKEGERPTMKQVMGAAAFNKKRFHPHPSKIKLLFIQRTREIFEALGFPLERTEEEVEKDFPTAKEFNETFQKNLQRARVLAARELRQERRFRTRATNRRRDVSRRINAGLIQRVR
jgi:hypothetical protein